MNRMRIADRELRNERPKCRFAECGTPFRDL
jgi:hypothetical protein